MATDHNDQFHMGRIPLRPYAYSKAKNGSQQNELAVTAELLIDYIAHDGQTEPTFDIYFVDPEDRSKFINLSHLIRSQTPMGDANDLTISINGWEHDISLREIINRIFSRYIFPDTESENFIHIAEKIANKDPDIINPVLTDEDGNIILPITSTTNVYDENGHTIQEKLDSMTRVGFATTYVVAQERGGSFEFELPFENYVADGNHIEVSIGGTRIDKSRYYITTERDEDDTEIINATITFTDHDIEAGRTISFLFIYNCASDASKMYIMSGANIAAHSLPSTAFEKMSDSFLYNDPTSVASSAAVYNLYMSVMNNYPYALYGADSTNPNSITVNVGNDAIITNGTTLYTITSNEKNINCKVIVNGIDYGVIQYGNQDISRIIPENTKVKLIYIGNKWHIKFLDEYVITPTRYIQTLVDLQTEVSYNGLAMDYITASREQLMVYKNGVRLFEGLDYRDDRSSKKITLLVPGENQDKIVFEILRVTAV